MRSEFQGGLGGGFKDFFRNVYGNKIQFGWVDLEKPYDLGGAIMVARDFHVFSYSMRSVLEPQNPQNRKGSLTLIKENQWLISPQ